MAETPPGRAPLGDRFRGGKTGRLLEISMASKSLVGTLLEIAAAVALRVTGRELDLADDGAIMAKIGNGMDFVGSGRICI